MARTPFDQHLYDNCSRSFYKGLPASLDMDYQRFRRIMRSPELATAEEVKAFAAVLDKPAKKLIETWNLGRTGMDAGELLDLLKEEGGAEPGGLAALLDNGK